VVVVVVRSPPFVSLWCWHRIVGYASFPGGSWPPADGGGGGTCRVRVLLGGSRGKGGGVFCVGRLVCGFWLEGLWERGVWSLYLGVRGASRGQSRDFEMGGETADNRPRGRRDARE
jgi:hypothetical protein